jgi:hypothetical protein
MGQAQTTNPHTINTNINPVDQKNINTNQSNKGYEFVSHSNTQNQQQTNFNPNNAINSNNQNNPQYNYQNVNHQQIIQNPNKLKFKALLNTQSLIDAFKCFSIDGKYLNQVRFDDSIERLFSRINIPSMHYTFLSERIYILLDESKDGKINEEEYVNGMKNVLTNKDVRLKCNIYN